MSGKPKTVRVRIPVFVQADGSWMSGERGSHHPDEWSVDSLEDGEVLCFVEADVPIPVFSEPLVIEGEVVDDA